MADIVQSTTSYNTIKEYEDALLKSMPAEAVKAYLDNPWNLQAGLGYKNKRSSVSYSILFQMAAKCSVIGAIINTRVNQVATFSRPARYTSDNVGFRVVKKDFKEQETDEDREMILSLEQFIEQCGYSYDPYRDSFDTFLRKYVRDSLTYDQACFEIIPDKKHRPAEFICVDASTIRATEYDPNNPDVSWVQLIEGQIEATFDKNELAFGVRNPRSNINVQPYGYSELEMLIQQVTSQLYAEDYNSKFFSNGGMTRGLLNIKVDPNGIGNKEQLDDFKAQWRAQVNGMSGAWKTPVVQIPGGVEFVNIGSVPSDLLFGNYMNWLINIACAIYAIDPAEINFPNNGGVSGTSSVFEGSQEQKLKNSKDKGLRPLLRFIESEINKHIIRKFTNKYVFQFVGIDNKTEEEILEKQQKEVKFLKTINELRAENDLPPIEDGDVILDSTWLNIHNQNQQQKQQEQQQQEEVPQQEEGTTEQDGEHQPTDEEIDAYVQQLLDGKSQMVEEDNDTNPPNDTEDNNSSEQAEDNDTNSPNDTIEETNDNEQGGDTTNDTATTDTQDTAREKDSTSNTTEDTEGDKVDTENSTESTNEQVTEENDDEDLSDYIGRMLQ